MWRETWGRPTGAEPAAPALLQHPLPAPLSGGNMSGPPLPAPIRRLCPLSTKTPKCLPLKPGVDAGLGGANTAGSRLDVAAVPGGAGANMGTAWPQEHPSHSLVTGPLPGSSAAPSGTQCICSWWPCPGGEGGQVALGLAPSCAIRGAGMRRSVHKLGHSHGVQAILGSGLWAGRQMGDGSEDRGRPPASSCKGLSSKAGPLGPTNPLPPCAHHVFRSGSGHQVCGELRGRHPSWGLRECGPCWLSRPVHRAWQGAEGPLCVQCGRGTGHASELS